MDHKREALLLSAGIELGGALERMMGNELLLVRMMQRFVQDENFHILQQALLDNNREQAELACHTVKGICANLGIEKLCAKLEVQLEQIRTGHLQNAKDMMPMLEQEYARVIHAIRRCWE